MMSGAHSHRFLRIALGAALVAQAVVFLPAVPAAAAGTALLPTPTATWVPNDTVDAIAQGDDGTVYVGGTFTYMGPYSGASVLVNAVTGVTATTAPKVAGGVLDQVSDGSGGWYLAGIFLEVGGLERQSLVHILPGGAVDPAFDAHCDGLVYALALSGATLYVGGTFYNIGGQPREGLAALSAADGSATSWNPAPTGGSPSAIGVIALDGSTLYVSGTFTEIGGAPRAGLAKLNTGSNTAAAWYPGDPQANRSVSAIAVTDDAVYLGGDFETIGAAPRGRLAKANKTTGALDSNWHPDANDDVRAIAVAGDYVYAGGYFSQVSLLDRAHIVRLSATTGLADAWRPDPNDDVNAITVSGDYVYVGGAFTQIAGEERLRAARLTAATPAAATPFAPNIGGDVWAIDIYGHGARIGGIFNSVDGVVRNHVAAFDPATGIPTSWDPNVDDRVNCILPVGQSIYVGGEFTHVGAVSRNHVAAISASTGHETAFNANVNTRVNALAISGSTLYVGGDFTQAGGQQRFGIAAVNASTGGLVSTWNPGNAGSVRALAVSGSTLYVGGSFTLLGGQPRNYIGAVATADGTVLPWDPSADNWVEALAVSGGTVYAGGMFHSIGLASRNHVGALSASTGAATGWNPSADDSVKALTVSGSAVYAAGDFEVVGGQTRLGVAELRLTDGSATPWKPDPESIFEGEALCLADTGLYAGGSTTWNFRVPNNLARYDYAGALDVVPIAGVNRYATAVEVSKKAFPAGADWVVVVTGENWPDALGGSALAGVLGGPILLTRKGAIPSEVLAEITRLGAGKAVILGSTAAVSSVVENTLKTKLGASDVARIGGANRYETARMVAERTIILKGVAYDGKAFAATGANFPDALGASPLAAKKGWPIYLVNPNGLDAGALSAMQSAGVTNVAILGGPTAVSTAAEQALKGTFGAANVSRIAGSNRYATAVEVAKYGVANAGLAWNKVAIATGQNFPDALAGGVLQAKSNSVLLLTPTATLDGSVRTALVTNKGSIYEVRFLGGPTAVSNAVRSAAASALN